MNTQKPKESETQLMDFFNKRKNVINQKLKRCRDYRNHNPTLTYRENTPKEELVLEHVIQFKKQFQQHIGQTRQLLLYPKNECDVYKFICTTIRPTKLGFLELYNYEQCAKRLSKFIQYEQLDPPDEFPRCVPSPANVAKWQKGDSFDMSILLTSLLIGVGYDAYCIYGIAPKQITTKNQALMECPFMDQLRRKQEEQAVSAQQTSKIEEGIFQKRINQSIFDRTMTQNQRRQKQQLAKKALTIDDDEPDQLAPDLYLGKRLHCWVLLKKGKRGVTQDLFIQPSTGRIYEIKNSPYLLVDAIFNNTNFFIHMQPKHKVDQIKFDLYETITWQYVMLQDQMFRNSGQDQMQELGDDSLNKMPAEEENLKYLAQTLDMPPPWSPKIYIEKDKFLKGTPLGQQTTFFIKMKVDKYAEYSQGDGLVLKYTLFQDFKKIKIKQIGYFYKNRSDKLERKYRYPYEFKTIQMYGPGKMPHWKQVTEIDRRMRIINYYPNRNHDGLIKRIEKIGQQTIEFYQNRDDHIISRSVSFVKDEHEKVNTANKNFYEDNHIGNVRILKMTQKFGVKKNIAASEQISKMNVDFVKQKLTVFYHMNEGQIEPIKKQYMRDQIHGYGKVDSNQKKNDDPVTQQEHQKLLNADKECYQSIKTNQANINEQYKQMRQGVLTIEKTLYEKAREKFNQNRDKQQQQVNQDDANDFLKPFLQKRGLSTQDPLPYNQAMQVKNQVMKKMKERIIARAKIIQQRLQKQQDLLKQLQEQYHKKQQQKNEKELSEVKFKISILQSRSSRFEAMALQRFQQMDQKLNTDKRLAIIHKDKK